MTTEIVRERDKHGYRRNKFGLNLDNDSDYGLGSKVAQRDGEDRQSVQSELIIHKWEVEL